MVKGNGKKSPFGKKQTKALYATFGDDDLYNSGRFNPYTRNLTTGKTLNRPHHCEQCNAKMTNSCYDKFHHAFCPTWVTRIRDGKRVRERCGERFALHSDGCGKHPRVQGYNNPLYRAAEGYDVDLSEFDDLDPEDQKDGPEDDDNDDCDAALEDHYREGEEMMAAGETLPPDFYTKFWDDRARERSIKESIAKSIAKTKRGAAANTGGLGTISEGKEHELTAVGRGQANIYANGRTGAGKKHKKSNVSFADGPLGKTGQGGQAGLTYGGPAVLQPKDGNEKLSRSYAPKGSKPKAPMEVPRKEKGKRAGRWWDKMNGEEKEDGSGKRS